MPTTSEILDALKLDQRKGRPLDTTLILALYSAEPRRWLSLLLLEGIVPDPTDKELHSSLKSLFQGLSGAIVDPTSLKNAELILQVVIALLTVTSTKKGIGERLLNLPLWDEPGTLVLRLAAFVESQAYLAAQLAATTTPQDPRGTDPVALARTTLPFRSKAAPWVARQNPANSLEELIECVELILRHARHSFRSTAGIRKTVEPPSPYEDPVFEKLLLLASAWRQYEDVWARIKFREWIPSSREGVMVVQHPDQAVFLREEASKYRSQAHLMELLLSEETLKNEVDSDTDWNIRQLSAGMSLPQIGQVWDGVLDIGSLRTCTRRTTYRRASEYLIQLRHYEPLADSLRKFAPFDWKQWFSAFDVLRVLASAFHVLVCETIGPANALGGCRSVVLASRDQLRKLFADVLGVGMQTATILLDELVFDERRKLREIWDQPLLPIGDENVVIVPSIIQATSAIRSLENLIDDKHGSFDVLGHAFENTIEAHLRACSDAQVARGKKLYDAQGRVIVEFDLVCWWKARLILIETKCLKSTHSPADEHHAWGKLSYAVQQLARRRELAALHWEQLRQAAPDLRLPAVCPPQTQTICIALTNILRFSGLAENGIFIADELSLMRFFGPAEAHRVTVSAAGFSQEATGHKVRDALSPEELLRYLSDPPQVRAFIANTKAAWLPLWSLNESDPRVVVQTSEFHGTADTLFPISSESGRNREKRARVRKEADRRKRSRRDSRKARKRQRNR